MILIILLWSFESNGQKPELKAEASEKISCTTIVDENEIRKINEIITKRVKEVTDSIQLEYRISFSNNFYFLGYNAPYELINRKNEVVVELINAQL